SRISHGEMITLDKLHRVEEAEEAIRNLGFRVVRVRAHEGVARIEVPKEDLPRMIEPATAAKVVRAVRDAGFVHVTIDLLGYRSGSIAAFLVSAGVAGALIALTWEFQGVGQQLFEGITMLVAVTVLTSMVLWMIQAARSIKVHVQERIDAVLRQSEVLGLALLSFVIVLREGVETALFVFGAGALTSPFEAV